jgi:hypothetical protein
MLQASAKVELNLEAGVNKLGIYFHLSQFACKRERLSMCVLHTRVTDEMEKLPT